MCFKLIANLGAVSEQEQVYFFAPNAFILAKLKTLALMITFIHSSLSPLGFFYCKHSLYLRNKNYSKFLLIYLLIYCIK